MALTKEQRNERLSNPNVRYLKDNLYDFQKGKPFLFISYKSDDWEVVLGQIVYRLAHDYHLRIYFDGSFDKKNDLWIEQFKRNMNSRLCKGVIAFFDNMYYTSYATLTELMHSQTEEATAVKPKALKSILGGLPVIPIQINGKPNINDIDEEVLEASTGLGDVSAEKERFVKDFSGIRKKIPDLDDYYSNGELNKAMCFKMTETIYSKLSISDNYYDPDNESFYSDIIDSIKDAVGEDVFDTCSTADALQMPFESNGVSEQITTNESMLPSEKTMPIVEKKRAETVLNIEGVISQGATNTSSITYAIYGKEYTDNQSNMMLNIFAKVLKHHPEAINKIFADPQNPLIGCVSQINYELAQNRVLSMPARYRSGRYFDIAGGIYVGTSVNYQEKLKNIAQLFIICGEDYSILQSEQIKLPEEVKCRNLGTEFGSTDGESYVINGIEKTGNQSEMLCDVLRFLIESHFDKRSEIESQLCAVQFKPLNQLDSVTYFRSGKEYEYQGVTYSIGTSFSRDAKLKQINKAAQICNEEIEQFGIKGMDKTSMKSSGYRSRSSSKRNFLDD